MLEYTRENQREYKLLQEMVKEGIEKQLDSINILKEKNKTLKKKINKPK